MAIINFEIPESLEKRVNQAIAEKGFVSKAEFFRMAAVYFLDSDKHIPEDVKTQHLVEAIRQEISNKYKGKKAPAVEDQVKDL